MILFLKCVELNLYVRIDRMLEYLEVSYDVYWELVVNG